MPGEIGKVDYQKYLMTPRDEIRGVFLSKVILTQSFAYSKNGIRQDLSCAFYPFRLKNIDKKIPPGILVR